MKRMFSVLLMSAALLATTHAFAAVSDEAVTTADAKFVKAYAEARQSGQSLGVADIGDMVDAAYGALAFDELTVDQTRDILNHAPVRYSLKVPSRLDAHMAKIAEQTDETGAKASLLRLELLPLDATAENEAAQLKTALAHPGLAAAVKSGYGVNVFGHAGNLPEETLLALQKEIIGVGPSMKPTASTGAFRQAANFFVTIAKTLKPDSLKVFSPLREDIVAALKTKLAGNVVEQERGNLESCLALMQGAYVRGDLIGSVAPTIDFLFYKDPNTDKQLKSLADLKGKVVVLDFWATWCGPCVASFPRVKELTRHYQGFDVVVLGVTSLQGFVVDAGSNAGAHIDTTDNPTKEFELTAAFAKAKDVVWPIAIAKQPVFNPDYGVTGIPDVVIIDTKGVVRYAGLHPMQPMEEKVKIIDALLSEGKKNVPALGFVMKKPVAAEGAK